MSECKAKFLSRDETLDLSLTGFPFSARAYTIFARHGLKTLRALVDTDAKAWLFTFECDKKTLGEIVVFLGMMGFVMKNSENLFSEAAIEGYIASVQSNFL